LLGKRALHDSQYSDDQSRDGIGTYTSLVDGHCKKWLPRWPKANVESHMSGEACGACSLTETGTAAKRQRDNQQRTKILTPSRWEEDTSDSRSNDRKHSSSPPSRSLQGSKQESKALEVSGLTRRWQRNQQGQDQQKCTRRKQLLCIARIGAE
jgi:hypothetical protein